MQEHKSPGFSPPRKRGAELARENVRKITACRKSRDEIPSRHRAWRMASIRSTGVG